MEIANLIAALRAPDCDNCPCIECKPDRNLTRCMLFDQAADVLEALTEVKSMPKNVKCKNCANLKRSGWCERVVDSPCPDLLRDCRYFRQKTNAQVIRSMTDEELAQLLLDGCRGSTCSEQPQNRFGSVNCFECRLKWLHQPVKEE